MSRLSQCVWSENHDSLDAAISERLSEIDRRLSDLTHPREPSGRLSTSGSGIQRADGGNVSGRRDIMAAEPNGRSTDGSFTREATNAAGVAVDALARTFINDSIPQDGELSVQRTSTVESRRNMRRLPQRPGKQLSDMPAVTERGECLSPNQLVIDRPTLSPQRDSTAPRRLRDNRNRTTGPSSRNKLTEVDRHNVTLISGNRDTLSTDRCATVIAPVDTVSDLTAGKKPVSPTIKLDRFCGDTPIRTHLAKFENTAFYYSWSPRDRLCHLIASLEGPAAEALWENPNVASETDLIRILCNRFDNINQSERFRAELRSRKRRAGESVQSVYTDIKRLMSLSFPGQAGEMYEIIARDSFLAALSDSALRVRVLDQSPVTLDETLSIVCRMEAYSNPVKGEDDGCTEGGRRRVRAVGAAKPADVIGNAGIRPDRDEHQALEGMVRELCKEVKQIKQKVETFGSQAKQGDKAQQFNGPVGPTPLVAPSVGFGFSGYGNQVNTGQGLQPVWSQWIPPAVSPPSNMPIASTGNEPTVNQNLHVLTCSRV